jgi:hypothetical protein
MRAICRALGWLFAVFAVSLLLFGLMSLPAGGPMFALPYVFFYSAILTGVIAGALLFATGRRIRR